MPCSSSEGMGRDCSHDAGAERRAYDEALAARREADELARMLCDLCREVEEDGQDHLFTRRIKEWWRLHKAQDARQRAPQQSLSMRKFLKLVSRENSVDAKRLAQAIVEAAKMPSK